MTMTIQTPTTKEMVQAIMCHLTGEDFPETVNDWIWEGGHGDRDPWFCAMQDTASEDVSEGTSIFVWKNIEAVRAEFTTYFECGE
jgi:hypothetical protein